MKVARVRRVLPSIALVATVVTFAAVLYARPGGDFVTRAINDVGQALAAFIGGVSCWWRSRRSSGRLRLSWQLFAGALLCWACGEVIWSYYEVFAGRETPFPSIADVGFLLLPALALPALLVRPSQAFAGRARIRVLLDGAMIAGSLFTLSWATTLGVVWAQGGQNLFAFTVSLAYPAGDVLMATVAVSVLAHTRARSGMTLVLGLVALGVADSGFTYLVATDQYNVVSYPDVAWVAAFLLIGAAALSRREDTVDVEQRSARDDTDLGSSGLLVLPYVVALVGVVALAVMFADGRATTPTLVVQGAAMCALFLRQLLVVVDNRRMALDIVSQQAQLRFRAFHDALTGLANRALFRDRVKHALDLHRRHERGVAVVLIDLDDFKAVNDSFGHHAGDTLLIAVGERLRAVTRAADTVARLGGDEFAVLCEDQVEIDVLAARLLEALSDPVVVADRSITVRASLGTACVKSGDETPTGEELLRRADIAMYVAKQSGKATVVAFSPLLAMTGPDDLEERFALVDDIRHGRLTFAIQPIVCPDGAPFAFEALARWQRNGVEVSPERFVPIAERGGVLADLDLFVARGAIAWLAKRTAGTLEQVPVSVNLGLSTLRRPDLVEQLLRLLTDCGLDPCRLMVEIPEGQAIAEPEVLAALRNLRSVGVLLAVDDFGVGYSNLAQLAALMPDVIKFDKSLIRPLGQHTTADRLLAGAMDLAHDLGAFVIAEGVEEPEQRALLVSLGCDAMQGFLLGRPERIDEFAPTPLAVVA